MTLVYEKKGRIAYITLNRPQALNAFDPEQLREFSQALSDFRDDPQLWVAIITGAGDRAFSSGADIKSLVPLLKDDWRFNPWHMPPHITRGLELWKPTIAAINGVALGGGLEVALACDIRVASERATFGLPEVKLGLIPGWGGTARLARLIPQAIAAQMILTGEPISAQEALRVGLINELTPAPALMAAAERWADKLCQVGPLAVRAAKEVMVRGMSLTLDDTLRLEWERLGGLFDTRDSVEGTQAFEERRKPDFKAQ
jgi:enoyl-CoA hydratase/carnithine racemase